MSTARWRGLLPFNGVESSSCHPAPAAMGAAPAAAVPDGERAPGEQEQAGGRTRGERGGSHSSLPDVDVFLLLPARRNLCRESA
jgi:hypothetical protein